MASEVGGYTIVDIETLSESLADAERTEEEALARLWLALAMDPESTQYTMVYRLRALSISPDQKRVVDTDDMHFYQGFADSAD